MKRSNMKSDIAVRTNCKPEGRIFPRRKVASKSHHLNGGIGDFETELSLAIQESLKYAQQSMTDSEDYMVNNLSEDSRGTHVAVDSNDNNIRKENETEATQASSDFTLEEVGRMKDLLLAQTELIQYQQEEISEKDKELKILRVENDNLQCRLTRMERRLALLRQKDGPKDAPSLTAAEETSKKSNVTDSFPNCSNFKRKSIFNKTDLKKQHKRNKLTFVKNKCKWRTLSKSNSLSRAQTSTDNEGESDKLAAESSMEEESGSDGAESENDLEDLEKEGSDKPSDDDEGEEEEDKSKTRVYVDYPVMQTETLYHMYCPRHIIHSLDTIRIQEKAACQLEVETPSWRMNPLTNMYQLEGTENITDEAYFKRHQKFELEEKRRKRWDLQRLRELRMFEKFEEEKETALRASNDEADMETFLPSIHDITHIEISNSVPVMAFGQPVPYVTPEEFSIPWDVDSSTPLSGRLKPNGGKGLKKH